MRTTKRSWVLIPIILVGLVLLLAYLFWYSALKRAENAEYAAEHGGWTVVNAGSEGIAEFKDLTVTFNLSPRSPPPNKSAHLSFAFTRRDSAPIDDLEIMHEKKVHLIVISEDLAVFSHIHPDRTAPGVYTLTHTFAKPSRYYLWAEFVRRGQSFVAEFIRDTAGRTAFPVPAVDLAREKEVQGHRVILDAEPVNPRRGTKTSFHFRITDATGGHPTPLGMYLGALGHMIVVRRDLQEFMHLHAEGMHMTLNPFTLIASAMKMLDDGEPKPGELHFEHTFPEPGFYKMWLQFQPSSLSRPLTAPFMVEIK